MFLLLMACNFAFETTEAPVCTNTCTDYTTSWHDTCPEGERCIEFKNSCDYDVQLAYQVGCNGDGTPGSPQCNCTPQGKLEQGKSLFWQIEDGIYADCTPYEPPCLTEGLAVLVNRDEPSCATGTRVEFTAGNKLNPYGRFDSYNLDIEKTFYSVPVSYGPDLTCARDHENHDCRSLYCDSAKCPDAYSTPTTGGCADGRSPQVGCQDTFAEKRGFVVEYCPATGTSCTDATTCTP